MQPSRGATIVRQARLLAAGVALLGAACKAPETKLDVGIDARGPYAEPSRYHVIVTQGGLSHAFDVSSMHVDAQVANSLSAGRDDIRLTPGTPVTVDVLVATASGNVAGRDAWTPREDVRYGVGAFVDTIRPRGFCFNIVQATPLPVISGTAVDTLFILHSGIGKGAIC
jgi:hypothetical protein